MIVNKICFGADTHLQTLFLVLEGEGGGMERDVEGEGGGGRERDVEDEGGLRGRG